MEAIIAFLSEVTMPVRIHTVVTETETRELEED